MSKHHASLSLPLLATARAAPGRPRRLGAIALVALGALFAIALVQTNLRIQATKESLIRLIGTEHPLIRATHEIEINLLEVATDTWVFLRFPDELRRASCLESHQEFLAHFETYRAISPNPELSQRLADRYAIVWKRVEGLKNTAVLIRKIIQTVRLQFDRIDDFLDSDLKGYIASHPEERSALESPAQGLEAEIAECQAAVASYLLHADTDTFDSLEEALGEAHEQLEALRAKATAESVLALISTIEDHFATAERAILTATQAQRDLTESAQELDALRAEFEALLDEEAQPAAEAAYELARQESERVLQSLQRSSLYASFGAALTAAGAAIALIRRSHRLARRNEELRTTLSRNDQLEQERRHLMGRLLTVEEEERLRLGRDLHDDLGQDLAILIMGLDRIQNGPQAAEAIALSEHAVQTLQRMKAIARSLRPAALHDLGLGRGLERLTNDLRAKTDIRVDLVVPSEDRYPATIQNALFRVAQEATTNALKHSGASAIQISLSRFNHWLTLVVEDDGRGFCVDEATLRGRRGECLGLFGMRERIELLAGHFAIESSEEGGTAVIARVPLPARDPE